MLFAISVNIDVVAVVVVLNEKRGVHGGKAVYPLPDNLKSPRTTSSRDVERQLSPL